MKNSDLQPFLGDKEVRKVAAKIVDWQMKNQFLIGEVSKLEKGKKFPIFIIMAFLLKSQLIEFELKQLITGLDLHFLKTTIRKPNQLDEKRFTLGRLRNEINKYEGSFLDDLKRYLSSLVTLRNEFVHELFNPGSINELVTKAKSGLKIANKVIESIETTNDFLKENDPVWKKTGSKRS